MLISAVDFFCFYVLARALFASSVKHKETESVHKKYL